MYSHVTPRGGYVREVGWYMCRENFTLVLRQMGMPLGTLGICAA